MADQFTLKGRKHQKVAERKLREALGMLQSWGLHFRRQAPRGSNVVDFISDEARLVIELDSQEHPDERQAHYNATRVSLLRAKGYRFLRFWIQDVLQNLAYVMAVVVAVLREQEERLKAERQRNQDGGPSAGSGGGGASTPEAAPEEPIEGEARSANRSLRRRFDPRRLVPQVRLSFMASQIG